MLRKKRCHLRRTIHLVSIYFICSIAGMSVILLTFEMIPGRRLEILAYLQQQKQQHGNETANSLSNRRSSYHSANNNGITPKLHQEIKRNEKEEMTSDSGLNLTELQQNLLRIIKKDDHIALSYYNLSRQRLDHCPFEFLINGSNICKPQSPFLIILVPSAPKHLQARMDIRETWGQYANNLTLPAPNTSVKVSIAFLMGTVENTTDTSSLLSESNKYQDIVIADFHDSYKNLTRKVLTGLKWVTVYCASAEYILKVDDDIFIHIPNLIEMLKRIPANSKGGIYGLMYPHGITQRKGKWAVSNAEYPMSKYPQYMSGNSYVISKNIAKDLLMASQYMPYLSIEDAFITGILSRIIGAQHVPRNTFTSWSKQKPEPCEFMKENMISGNRMDTGLMKTMWFTQLNYTLSCQH